MLSQIISVSIQLASTVVLARLLSPDDYGVMAMAMAITSFAGLFRDLGLSAAAIQKGELSHAQMSNLFWLNTGMGALLTVILALSSPLVAWFYGKPELLPVTLLLSSTFLINSLGTQHGALLQRNLQFSRNAMASIVGSAVNLVVGIILALQDHGYWALCWGTVIGNIVTTSLLFAFSPFRPGFWTRGVGMKSMLKFGASITTFDFVNYFHRNFDNLLIGKFWGADALGFYSRAYQLMLFPVNNLRGPITTVSFPAMSRLQNHADAFRAYYKNITSLLAFMSMPMTAFLFIEADSVIRLALGPSWSHASQIFSILAISGFIQPVSSLRGTVLMSLGKSKKYVIWGIINAIFISISFMIGVIWGPVGVAWAYVIATYAILQPSLLYVFYQTPVSYRDFWSSIWQPLIASVVCCLTVYAAKRWLAQDINAWVELALSSVLFTLVYLAAFLCMPGGKAYVLKKVHLFKSIRS